MKDGSSIGPRLAAIALMLAAGLGSYLLGKNGALFTTDEVKAPPAASLAVNSSPSPQTMPPSHGGHAAASPQTKTKQELEELAREIVGSRGTSSLVLQDLEREWRQRLLRLNRGDLAELDRIVKEMKPQRFSYWARNLVLTTWAAQDGPAALARLAEDKQDRQSIPKALGAWAETDLQAAVLWLCSKGKELRRDDEPVAFADEWARLPSYLLASYAVQDRGFFEAQLREADHEEAAGIFKAAAFKWWRDPAMRDWLGELALHHEAGEIFRSELAAWWAMEDPQAATTYIASRDMPPEEKLKAEAAVVKTQAYTQPRAALDGWMERHGEFHPDLSDTVESWARESPDEALHWVAALADETRREELYTYVLSQGAWGDTINWRSCGPTVRSIKDPALRRDALRRLDRLVAQRAPDELAAWRADLPEADRAELAK